MVDKECKSECVCQASGLVRCGEMSCASGEVCSVRDGVRACHTEQGHCSINPAGHLSTFDGLSGPISAQGAYEVAALCDEASALWFRVVVDVRICSKGAPKSVAAVYVFFKETVVAVTREREIWVRAVMALTF